MKKSMKVLLVIAIILVAMIAGSFGCYYYFEKNKIVTVVTMDINPSIEISLNEDNNVVKVIALNKDAEDIIKDKKFKWKNLESTIEEISDSVIDKGYISKENNYILINVDGKDIEDNLTKIINKSFEDDDIELNVVVQEISDTSSENAEKYNISESKASYIEDIINKNSDLTFEELSDKSINEINNIVIQKEEEKKKQEEQQRLEEEKKKKEEEEKKKQEEEKKNQANNNNSSSNNSGSSSGGGSGSIHVCETVVFNFENDEIMTKALADVGLVNDIATNINASAQTIAKVYNGMCTYQTMFFHNKLKYTYYHNVTTGEVINKFTEAYVAGTYQDAKDVVINYFITQKGALAEELFVYGGGGTINEATRTVDIKWNDVKYLVEVNAKSGAVLSVKQQ